MHRAATQRGQLSEHSACDQRRGDHRRRRHTSGLRLLIRKREFRGGLRGFAYHLYRSLARDAAADGREGAGAPRDGRRRGAHCAGQRRHRRAMRTPLAAEGEPHRLSADHQSVGGRRRQGHARGAQPGGTGDRFGRPPATKPSRLSASPTFTWKSSSSGRGTSNFRYWATTTATFCIWASASAAFSGGTRNWWKNRPRWR